jgi:hypothetical protein
VRIDSAEAGPESASDVSAEAPGDFVTAAEAAAIVGVDALGFKSVSQSAGFPAVCGHIDVYSRSAVTRWAALRSGTHTPRAAA